MLFLMNRSMTYSRQQINYPIPQSNVLLFLVNIFSSRQQIILYLRNQNFLPLSQRIPQVFIFCAEEFLSKCFFPFFSFCIIYICGFESPCFALIQRLSLSHCTAFFPLIILSILSPMHARLFTFSTFLHISAP